MTIRWTNLAAERLREIKEHITRNSDRPKAARRQVRLVVQAIDQLIDFPQSGRAGRVDGTRELVIPRTPYVVPYRIRGEAIEVLDIEHGAQQWPEHF